MNVNQSKKHVQEHLTHVRTKSAVSNVLVTDSNVNHQMEFVRTLMSVLWNVRMNWKIVKIRLEVTHATVYPDTKEVTTMEVALTSTNVTWKPANVVD